jgi:hypothetical protein
LGYSPKVSLKDGLRVLLKETVGVL